MRDLICLFTSIIMILLVIVALSAVCSYVYETSSIMRLEDICIEQYTSYKDVMACKERANTQKLDEFIRTEIKNAKINKHN